MQLAQKLKELGWSQWYNPGAWVNSEILPPELKKCADYTCYPVSPKQAYKISTNEAEREKYIEAIRASVMFGKIINRCWGG